MRVGKGVNVIGEKAALARHRLPMPVENDLKSAGGSSCRFSVLGQVIRISWQVCGGISHQ